MREKISWIKFMSKIIYITNSWIFFFSHMLWLQLENLSSNIKCMRIIYIIASDNSLPSMNYIQLTSRNVKYRLTSRVSPSGAISLSWKHHQSTPSLFINSKFARTVSTKRIDCLTPNTNLWLWSIKLDSHGLTYFFF